MVTWALFFSGISQCRGDNKIEVCLWSGRNVALRNMGMTVKREGKNHPTKSLKVPTTIPSSNLLLFPKNPGLTLRQLRTTVE